MEKCVSSGCKLCPSYKICTQGRIKSNNQWPRARRTWQTAAFRLEIHIYLFHVRTWDLFNGNLFPSWRFESQSLSPWVSVSVKTLLLVSFNSPQTFRFFLRCSSISSDYCIIFCNKPDSQKRDPKGNMLVTRGLPICVPKRIWWNLPSLRALTNRHWTDIFNSKMSYLSSWEYYNQRQTALGATVPALGIHNTARNYSIRKVQKQNMNLTVRRFLHPKQKGVQLWEVRV